MIYRWLTTVKDNFRAASIIKVNTSKYGQHEHAN